MFNAELIDQACQDIAALSPWRVFGRVSSVQGMLIEVGGLDRQLALGGRVAIERDGGTPVPCEVVGFRAGRGLLLPLGTLDGVGLGCRAILAENKPVAFPCEAWLGRVVDAFGNPIDNKGPLPRGPRAQPLLAAPPPAASRKRLGGPVDLGVRAINTFVSCVEGQRLGIFSGSGVGKSVMLSMMARYTDADVSVIGLIGERGREVQEFIEDDLGEEGLARSVVVVATSDEPPLRRRQAAYLTLAIAEWFRDVKGANALCLMDSVTRFAMAQREIGLSAGEPPTSKGYPPTTFAELARLLERAGPGLKGGGSITGLFSVLVEGDDHNEPVADAVRGILDGHIVLDRKIADRGRYPAVDVLRSVSRSMPACHDARQTQLIRRAKELLSTYEDMADLIRLGAYREGTNPQVDKAMSVYPRLEEMLRQQKGEQATIAQAFDSLEAILATLDPGSDSRTGEAA